MAQAPLTNDEITEALRGLDGWAVMDDKLTRKYKFKDFREAIGFLVRVAFEAEQMDHHPEVYNVYNNVTLALTTHDVEGKVTQKDVDLASRINDLA